VNNLNIRKTYNKLPDKRLLWFCLNLQQRTMRLLSQSFPLPNGMGRRIRRKKGKNPRAGTRTVWQREKKTTINNTDKKHIQHTVFSLPDAQLAPE